MGTRITWIRYLQQYEQTYAWQVVFRRCRLLPVGSAAFPDREYEPYAAYCCAEEAEYTEYGESEQAGATGYSHYNR